MKNKKNVLERIIIFLFFTLLVSIVNLNTQSIDYDRSWVFHACQKIANGEIIYKDINILSGPLFYLIGGAILKTFGINYFVFEIYGGIIYGIFSVVTYDIMKKINVKNYKIIDAITIIMLYCFTRVLSMPNYNTLSLIFIMIGMRLELEKTKATKKDFINISIGAILGLAFYTKQTVAGMAVLATGVIWLVNAIKEKKLNIKEVLEKAGGFISVLLVGIIIMMKVGNFYEYLNYCFGSLIEFGANNKSIVEMNLYYVIVLAVTFASIKLSKENESFLILTAYTIAGLSFIIPIGNTYHKNISAVIGFFLILKLLIVILDSGEKNFIKLIAIIIIVSLNMSVNNINIFSDQSVADSAIELNMINGYEIYTAFLNIMIIAIFGFSLIKQRPKFFKTAIVFLGIASVAFYTYNYVENIKQKEIPKGLEIYERYGITEENLKKISKLVEYTKQKEKEGYEVIGISWDAAKYMAPLNKNNKPFDLLLKGNLGYKGEEKTLDQLKQMHNTIIIKNTLKFWQEPEKIMEYVTKQCELIDAFEDVEVYIKR